MEKFENFCQQKWIFAVFAFFSTVFWRISEFSALTQNLFRTLVISVAVHLFHMKVEE
jgi:hypothetical protein